MTTFCFDGDDGPEVLLYHEPHDAPTLYAKCGDHYVVGYYVYDSDCEDPMTSCDGQGVISDDASHLGLVDWGKQWGEPGSDAPYIRDLDIDDEDDAFEYALKAAIWDHEYDEGRIGTFLAVPLEVYERSSVHYLTCGLAGAKAVWVPGENEIDNMQHRLDTCKTHAEKMRVAVDYAKGVLDERNQWADGDCYGYVVEWFDEDGEQVEHDSCWGFIGEEYVMQELKENFAWRCEDLMKEYNKAVRTASGAQLEMML